MRRDGFPTWVGATVLVALFAVAVTLSMSTAAHREDEQRIAEFCGAIAGELDRSVRLDSWGLEKRVRYHALDHATLRLCTHRDAPYSPATRDAAESCARAAVTAPDGDRCFVDLARELASAYRGTR